MLAVLWLCYHCFCCQWCCCCSQNALHWLFLSSLYPWCFFIQSSFYRQVNSYSSVKWLCSHTAFLNYPFPQLVRCHLWALLGHKHQLPWTHCWWLCPSLPPSWDFPLVSYYCLSLVVSIQLMFYTCVQMEWKNEWITTENYVFIKY